MRFNTLTRPMKCTPLWSKLYQPSPCVLLAESFEIRPTVVVEHIVLAGDVEDAAGLDALEDCASVSNSSASRVA